MNARKVAGVCLAFIALHTTPAQSALSWSAQVSGTTQRLRAVSAVSPDVAWASGAHGVVLKTIDRGRTWQLLRVPDGDELDFRDIEAFDAQTAYVLSVGHGASSRIYKTVDGGAHWTLQFINGEGAGFYNAIAFWNRDRGLAFGDPVAGRFTVLRTENGGDSWTRTPKEMPAALPGESAFAASGGCLAVNGRSDAWFGTGGASRARVFRTGDGGRSWSVADTPVIAGRDSAGVFALTFADAQHGVAVGGDFREEDAMNANLASTSDGGRTWTSIGASRLPGLRSSVAFIPGSKGLGLIAVGPRGSDLSADGGRTWMPLGGDGSHALALTGATHAQAIWAVGENGRILKLLFKVDKPIPPAQSKQSSGRSACSIQFEPSSKTCDQRAKRFAPSETSRSAFV